jgi:TrmH family RNA methyltransferase
MERSELSIAPTIPVAVRIVLVEPEGRMNFGQVLRLSRNFGIDDICVVNPKFDIHDPEVVEFAAGGSVLLEKVKIVDDLGKCLEGVSISVCTTSIAGSSDDPLRQAVSPKAIRWLVPSGSRIALVFGRESVGLTRSELSMCSLISTILTPSDYNVLNLSHAVALYLYELLGPAESLVVGERCPSDYIDIIIRYVEKLGSAYGMSRDEVASLKHVLNKAALTKVECRVLYKLLKSALAIYSKARKLCLEPPDSSAGRAPEAAATEGK